MNRVDVAVIGGGPAGLQAARRLAGQGFEVVLFEEHSRVGLPQHCTGLVSVRGFAEWIRAPQDTVLWKVRGAVLHAPNGMELYIDAGRPVAYVLDRVRFEEALLEEASALGVAAGLGVHAGYRDGLVMAGDRILRAGLIVDARGLPRGARGALPALQYDYSTEPLSEVDVVHLFFGEKYSRGFFAWIVPLGDDAVRIGLASLGAVKERLDGFSKLVDGAFFRLKRRTRVLGGAVYVGGPIYPFYRGGVAKIGDRAGQTKPTTGGGLVYHSIAAEMLARALREGDVSLYEGLWRKMLGREVALQLAVRKMLSSLSDEEYNSLFQAAREAGVEGILNRGDMDMQSRALLRAGVKTFMRAPRLALTLLYKLLRGLVSAP